MNSAASDAMILRSNAPRVMLTIVTSALIGGPFIVGATALSWLLKENMLIALAVFSIPFIAMGIILACILGRINKARVKFTSSMVTFPVVQPGRRKLRWIKAPYAAITGIGHLPRRPGQRVGQMLNEAWVVQTTQGDWTLDRELLGENARVAAEEISARMITCSSLAGLPVVSEIRPEEAPPPAKDSAGKSVGRWIMFSAGALMSAGGLLLLIKEPTKSLRLIVIGIGLMVSSGAVTKPTPRTA